MKYCLLFWICPLLVIAQRATLKGIVQSSHAEPLPFVTVTLKNTKFVTTSDQQGNYQMKDIPYGDYEVEFSFVGFQSQTKTISIKQPNLTENAKLVEAIHELSEVVVAAEKQSSLQQQKAISIKSIDIKEVITQNNLLTDVADRVSGVRIRRSSSLGEKSDISINGMRGNAIRVYIDGLPMEFLYPNFDISTLPLSNIKRVDVFKGVLPVDVGTDAMGGAINIITEQKAHSHLRASYSVGSFNTHLADVEVGLANKNNFFFNANASYNYSDNSYTMKALVFEKNRVETVRRFHDAYGMWFGGLSFGGHSKKWADEVRFTANYSTGFKELQNGARITTTAIGEANYTAENYSASLKYNKSFLKERLQLSNITSYSFQTLDYVDTTANEYSWSGKIVGRSIPGEYVSKSYNTTNYDNWINRTTLTFALTPKHKILFSNLYASQRLTGKNYLLEENERDYLEIPQYMTKNIAGLQYEAMVGRNITFSGALKRFDYVVNGAENNTFLLVKKQDSFSSWNVGIKYNLSDNLFVRTSYERGFLIPLFQQFVGNGADIVRNTELRPESSDNLNFGISYANARLSNDLILTTNINGFWREQYDIIFLGSSITKRYDNADQVNTLGVEGDLILNYKKAWTWKSNLTALRKRFSSLKDPRNAFLEGTTFPNNPTFFGNTELEWQKSSLFRNTDRFRAYVFYQYVAPFNHILIGQDDTYQNSPDSFVPTQHRVDVGASYKFAKQSLTAAFNVNNVFNAQLFDNFLVPRAGINYNLKLIFEINKF